MSAVAEREIRVWPGVTVVTLQAAAWFGLPLLGSEFVPFAFLGGLVGGLGLLVWWAFFSRAPRSERWGGVLLLILAPIGISFFLHESIATAMMGLMFPVFSIPILGLVFVSWAVFCGRLSARSRRGTMIAAVLVAVGGWTLVRSEGMTGDASFDYAWRWSATAEERFLAEVDDEPVALAASQAPTGRDPSASWPGFRGARRDGIVRGLQIDPDWTASPPVEVWRRRIGPGCSSFAVGGGLLYTQEQRGEEELVSCYDVATGAPVWRHRDTARFWDSHAGSGPRSTPTVSGDRVYSLGATGILNALDATDGARVWSRDVAEDGGAKLPGWGFTSSPLVLDDLVVVHVGALHAYDRATGTPRWSGAAEAESYSSPHSITIGGVPQIVLLSSSGVTGVSPSRGKILWEHLWKGGSRVVQPALTGDGDLLLGADETGGFRRITARREADGWITEERWTTRRLRPYFNDFVVFGDHAYGFDGRLLACLDLEAGEREWKGGRFGHGQLLLLEDQGLLLVLSEQGELALVEASPDGFREIARIPAVDGKTWNHPALAGDLLLVRNSREMVAFRLSRAPGEG